MTSEWFNTNQYKGYELEVKCKFKFSLFRSIYILTNARLKTQLTEFAVTGKWYESLSMIAKWTIRFSIVGHHNCQLRLK